MTSDLQKSYILADWQQYLRIVVPDFVYVAC